jgi:serine/threonine protein kinase
MADEGGDSTTRPRPSFPASSSSEGGGEDPLIGRVLNDRVKVVRAIARGGMGKVYLGEQVAMGRPCAIKVLDPKVIAAQGEEFKKRFVLEASISSKLTHPNVVTIFDYGQTADGICYIAMEYLEGKTLAAELREHGRLPWERAVNIARQMCRALREAHTLGVVHRDMKPGNVFLNKGGNDDEGDFIKVLDFGLVKETHPEGDNQHTQIGQIMGSPRYMAPEQIQGTTVDGRTDIYSTGAVMYAMLTGKPPFDRNNEMATMMAHVSEKVPPMRQVVPDLVIPDGLEHIVLKCLEKNPDNRFTSMEELLVALKLQAPFNILSSGSGAHLAASVSSLSPPAIPPPKRSRAWVAALAVAVVIGGVIVGLQRNGDSGSGPTQGGPAMTSSAPAVTATASVAPPPKPAVTLTLHIETNPPGAKVKEDDLVICAATPCEVVYKGENADASIEHLLVFQKSGYRVERKIARADKDPLVVKLSRQ